MRFLRVWRPSGARSHHNHRGLGGKVCVFFVLGALRRLKPLRGPTGGPGTSSSGSNIGSRGTVAE